MLEQDLLDLARIDIRATVDDHILGAVLERQEAVAIERAEVTRPQPTLTQRAGGGRSIVPVAAHHAIAFGDDLAHPARWQVDPAFVDDPYRDARARHADAAQTLLETWVRVIPMHLLVEARDRHRALALTIE